MTETHTHHHWNFADIGIGNMFTWIIILFVGIALVAMINNASDNKQYIYRECVSACSKPFSFWANNYNTALDYDMTECVNNCNRFYMTIK